MEPLNNLLSKLLELVSFFRKRLALLSAGWGFDIKQGQFNDKSLRSGEGNNHEVIIYIQPTQNTLQQYANDTFTDAFFVRVQSGIGDVLIQRDVSLLGNDDQTDLNKLYAYSQLPLLGKAYRSVGTNHLLSIYKAAEPDSEGLEPKLNVAMVKGRLKRRKIVYTVEVDGENGQVIALPPNCESFSCRFDEPVSTRPWTSFFLMQCSTAKVANVVGGDFTAEINSGLLLQPSAFSPGPVVVDGIETKEIDIPWNATQLFADPVGVGDTTIVLTFWVVD